MTLGIPESPVVRRTLRALTIFPSVEVTRRGALEECLVPSALMYTICPGVMTFGEGGLAPGGAFALADKGF